MGDSELRVSESGSDMTDAKRLLVDRDLFLGVWYEAMLRRSSLRCRDLSAVCQPPMRGLCVGGHDMGPHIMIRIAIRVPLQISPILGTLANLHVLRGARGSCKWHQKYFALTITYSRVHL